MNKAIETKPMTMITRSCTVRLLTPAFLGDAEQNGTWRTPPFKALLRQWWRVAYAAQRGFRVDLRSMRHEEGMLFGHAWLDDDINENRKEIAARKSSVRIRLRATEAASGESWTRGSQLGVTSLPTDQSTSHAWFGLINRGGGLSDRSAIKAVGAESSRSLMLAFPETCDATMLEVLSLIDEFGVVGSRSRGGWGSVRLVRETAPDAGRFAKFTRDWTLCLNDDWAMSIAKDHKPWIWQSTRTYMQWHEAMKDIALERKRVREALKSVGGTDLRFALGFAGKGRMPSPLRWKVVVDSGGKLRMRAFALPHRLPADSGNSLRDADLRRAWSSVCEALDASRFLVRHEGSRIDER